jgi:hypothetical protein
MNQMDELFMVCVVGEFNAGRRRRHSSSSMFFAYLKFVLLAGFSC